MRIPLPRSLAREGIAYPRKARALKEEDAAGVVEPAALWAALQRRSWVRPYCRQVLKMQRQWSVQ
jgi:hypothetical protein